jgi:hypothetical protein
MEKIIMKKLLFTTVMLSAWNVAAMELQLRSENSGIIVRPNADTLITRPVDQSIASVNAEETVNLSPVVNLRQVRDPQRDGELVEVSVRDFRDLNAQVPNSGWYTRQYPLQKTLLRYNHNLAAGFSSPVQKLYAMVNDIEHADRSGEIIVDPGYLDNATRIPHQRRANGQYANDDANRRAKPLTEIFINTGGSMEIVDPAKSRDDTAFVAYTRINTPARINTIGVPEVRANDAQFNYQRTETLEDWRRPDGTIFTQRTEGVQKVAKPPQPAPVPAPPSQPGPGGTGGGGGGPSNIFERAWHGIFG